MFPARRARSRSGGPGRSAHVSAARQVAAPLASAPGSRRGAEAAIGLTLGALAASSAACALLVTGCLALVDGAGVSPGAPSVDSLIGAVVLGAGACAAAWVTWWLILALGCLVAAGIGNRQHRLERLTLALAPAVARRLLATALGASLALGAVPAQAQEIAPVADIGWQVTSGSAEATASTPAPRAAQDPTPATAATVAAAADPSPSTPTDLGGGSLAETGTSAGEVPDSDLTPPAVAVQEPSAAASTPAAPSDEPRPDAAPQPITPQGQHAPSPTSPADRTVTVRAGDTLWSLAGAELGTEASDALIAAAWPLWHDANRDILADNPHLIQPGDVLAVPSSTDPAARG